jgi:hypothetical protein
MSPGESIRQGKRGRSIPYKVKGGRFIVKRTGLKTRRYKV